MIFWGESRLNQQKISYQSAPFQTVTINIQEQTLRCRVFAVFPFS